MHPYNTVSGSKYTNTKNWNFSMLLWLLKKYVLWRSMDWKWSIRLVFAEGLALERTQTFARRKLVLYRILLIILVTAYIILSCKLKCQYAWRLCSLLLSKSCFFIFLLWLCFSLRTKSSPFLSSDCKNTWQYGWE